MVWMLNWSLCVALLPLGFGAEGLGKQLNGHFKATVSLTGPIPGGAGGKESACPCKRCKRFGLIPGLGRSPRGGNGNPPQYSCLGNPMDRGAWQVTVHGGLKRVGKDLTTKNETVHILFQLLTDSSVPFYCS